MQNETKTIAQQVLTEYKATQIKAQIQVVKSELEAHKYRAQGMLENEYMHNLKTRLHELETELKNLQKLVPNHA